MPATGVSARRLQDQERPLGPRRPRRDQSQQRLGRRGGNGPGGQAPARQLLHRGAAARHEAADDQRRHRRPVAPPALLTGTPSRDPLRTETDLLQR